MVLAFYQPQQNVIHRPWCLLVSIFTVVTRLHQAQDASSVRNG